MTLPQIPVASEDWQRISDFVGGKKERVCLQFPDSLLSFSSEIAKKIEVPELADGETSRRTTRCYVMADTTFGSCCIDKVAGEHGNAEGIIHFGPACLSQPSKDCPPVLWVFERNLNLNLLKLRDALLTLSLSKEEADVKKKILILCDTSTQFIMPALKEALIKGDSNVGQETFIFSTMRDSFDPSSTVQIEEGIEELQGRFFPSIPSSAEYSLVYIGPDNLTFTNLMMHLPCSAAFSFDPTSNELKEHVGQASTQIRRRYIMVQKAKDANTIGIVVGTLAIANYLDVIESLKTLILSRGKKPYILAMGKPNPAKLGNFLEIDVFCLVACPENSLLDNRDFMRPIVTPYELSLALDLHSIWNPSLYELSLKQIVPRIENQIIHDAEERIRLKDLGEDEEDASDEEPHFSLVTGGMAINKQYTRRNDIVEVNAEDGATALVKKWSGHVSKYTTISVGAEYLNSRQFKGLEVDLGSQVAELEIGRSGIARGYANEES